MGLFPFIFLIVFGNVLLRVLRNLNESDRTRKIQGPVKDVEYREVTPQPQPQPQPAYVRSAKIQSLASDAAAQEKRIPVQSNRLYGIIHSTFGAGSLTGKKYLSVVNAAYEKIHAGHTTLLNMMQAFDEKGYVHLQQLINSGAHSYDNIDDSIQTEQLQLYEKQLDRMTEVLNANERIFLFLEKLALELQGMGSAKENQATIDLLNEIQSLIGDVKYYN